MFPILVLWRMECNPCDFMLCEKLDRKLSLYGFLTLTLSPLILIQIKPRPRQWWDKHCHQLLFQTSYLVTIHHYFWSKHSNDNLSSQFSMLKLLTTGTLLHVSQCTSQKLLSWQRRAVSGNRVLSELYENCARYFPWLYYSCGELGQVSLALCNN